MVKFDFLLSTLIKSSKTQPKTTRFSTVEADHTSLVKFDPRLSTLLKSSKMQPKTTLFSAVEADNTSLVKFDPLLSTLLKSTRKRDQLGPVPPYNIRALTVEADHLVPHLQGQDPDCRGRPTPAAQRQGYDQEPTRNHGHALHRRVHLIVWFPSDVDVLSSFVRARACPLLSEEVPVSVRAGSLRCNLPALRRSRLSCETGEETGRTARSGGCARTHSTDQRLPDASKHPGLTEVAQNTPS